MDDIIVFGHSVTQGFWDPEGGWVSRLRSFLDTRALETGNEENVFFLYNLGVSGDTVSDVLRRIEDEYSRRTEEGYDTLLILQIGANDAIEVEGEGYVTTREEFRQNIDKLLDLSKKLADEVVVVGDFVHDESLEMIPYAPERRIDHEKFHRYEEIKKELCNDHGIQYIDLLDMMDKEESSEFLEEGVHPNSDGHEKIFEKVKKEMVGKLL